MTDWQPIETAPKDGSSVLLWARMRANPPEKDSFFPVVGFWQPYPVERWKARDTEDDLIATRWAPIPRTEGEQ